MPHYFPPAGSGWERMTPAAAGLDPDRLAGAVAFAKAHECDWPLSMYHPDGRYVGTAHVQEGPPWDTVIGAVRERGPTTGLVVRGGRIVAEWGDIGRADMTFSVAKSYLALVAGLAVDRGLIRSIDDRVADYVDDGGFASSHNGAITWRHLLQQTSEWEGTLWDKPDSVDRNRQAGPGSDNSRKGTKRTLEAPGTRWEYNDVRVNRLSLALMQVFRRPLPEVLRESVMTAIGASTTWEWRGYRNSVVDIGGRPMESVSGGGHWGGGLFISSLDHARVGYLVHRGGVWAGRRLMSAEWIRELSTPCAANPIYGCLWWLNTRGGMFPSAPADSIFAVGGGTNLIWLDPEHDIVMVARWIAREHVDGVIARVLDSVLT